MKNSGISSSSQSSDTKLPLDHKNRYLAETPRMNAHGWSSVWMQRACGPAVRNKCQAEEKKKSSAVAAERKICRRRLIKNAFLVTMGSNGILLPRIGSVHGCNFAGYRTPFQLSADWLAAFDALMFFPLEKFVSESG
jgi:hypothetical protein